MAFLAPAASRPGCAGCEGRLDADVTMAFQPIVDVASRTVWGHEALVRGLGDEGAGAVLARVPDANRLAFDQRCRVRAVEVAARIGLPGTLSVNFLPSAIYEPRRCLRSTLEAAERAGLSPDRLLFEVTEGERVGDRRHLKQVLAAYRTCGLRTAIDDFGAGYAGLSLLAEFQPDFIKVDMDLVRGIEADRARRVLVGAVVAACKELGVEVIAEGVETVDEMGALRDLGITLMQGYLFARPILAAQPVVLWPEFA